MSLLTVGLLASGVLIGGDHQSEATAAATRAPMASADSMIGGDPMSDIADRSPGFRTGDTLPVKTVLFRPLHPGGREERVLFGVRDRVVPPVVPPFGPVDISIPPPEPIIEDGTGSGDFTRPIGPICCRGGFLPIVDRPVSSVPEPASWAMMILGLFGAGAAMRRRATRHHRAPAGVGHASD